jgi:hypothetical protein
LFKGIFSDVGQQNDTLKAVGSYSYYMLDKNGEKVEEDASQGIAGGVTLDRKNAFAPKHNMVAFADITGESLTISDAKTVHQHSQRKGIPIYFDRKYNLYNLFNIIL